MSNKTEINPQTNSTVINSATAAATEISSETSTSTIINSEIGASTSINPALTGTTPSELTVGTLLNGKYEIAYPLGVSTGEAELYVCRQGEKEYVAKLYRRANAIKADVTAKLKAISSPYVAKLVDIGKHNGHTFEILPFYKNGSLQGRTFSFEELKKTIIPCINEGLRALHEKGIIHKDLKPSNLMLADDGKSVAIIDFGISSVTDEENTVVVTKTGMTPEYSAPETFKSLFLLESDYYSLGITLCELYSGSTPYKNKSADEITKYTAVQRIPLPKNMPQELKDLIFALTYIDLSNRNNKKNPNRRWTYTEVDNWCKGKLQVIPGAATDAAAEKAIPPYEFDGKKYTDTPSLINALAGNWSAGKKELYRGHLSAFFKTYNPEVAAICTAAEEEATRTAGKDDIIFWDLLYKLYPELKGFYWMGQIYETISALGRDMLERLWKDDKSNHSYWDGILSNRLLTHYLTQTNFKNEALFEACSALEATHCVANKSKRDSMMNYYTMAYLLSGQKLLAVGDKRLKSVSELTQYMKNLLDSSYEEFENFCHSLIDYEDNLDVQLEAWLIALGKRNELKAWRKALNS